MPKIQMQTIRRIIKEELLRFYLSEGSQQTAAIDHAKSAAKCLEEIEKYKEASTSKAMAELGENLDRVEQVLNRIVSSPMEYADAVVLDDDSEDSSEMLSSSPAAAHQKKTIKPKISGGSRSTM